MDAFMSLAKQGFDAYSQSQSQSQPPQPDVNKTGGQEFNSPHHSGQPGRPQQWNYGDHDINHDDVVRTAQQHGSGDDGLYSGAMNYVKENQHATHQEPVDDEHLTNAHQQAYQQDNASGMSAGSIGSAAAMQILQKFTSGGSGGGSSKTELISMAMAEASKLFDKSGGGASGTKQDAVNGAAMTVMKLFVQSKFSGGTTGGGDSGGLGSLLSMASKFA